MNYIKITKHDIANGEGVRCVLWVSGCKLHCENCHNPQTWDFNSGMRFDNNAKQELLEALNKPYIQGITFSGGHPLEPQNIHEVYQLIKEIRSKFPNKDIWLYTGYTLRYENFRVLLNGRDDESNHWNAIHDVINLCDVVVDGPYIEEQRDITLPFVGSKNQRLIDVNETIKQGQIIQYKIN